MGRIWVGFLQVHNMQSNVGNMQIWEWTPQILRNLCKIFGSRETCLRGSFGNYFVYCQNCRKFQIYAENMLNDFNDPLLPPNSTCANCARTFGSYTIVLWLSICLLDFLLKLQCHRCIFAAFRFTKMLASLAHFVCLQEKDGKTNSFFVLLFLTLFTVLAGCFNFSAIHLSLFTISCTFNLLNMFLLFVVISFKSTVTKQKQWMEFSIH